MTESDFCIRSQKRNIRWFSIKKKKLNWLCKNVRWCDLNIGVVNMCEGNLKLRKKMSQVIKFIIVQYLKCFPTCRSVASHKIHVDSVHFNCWTSKTAKNQLNLTVALWQALNDTTTRTSQKKCFHGRSAVHVNFFPRLNFTININLLQRE